MDNNFRLVVSAAVLMGSFTVAFAQGDWTKKPFSEWTKTDVEAVLNDSAWAVHQELRIKFAKETQTAAGSYSGVSSAAAAQSQTEVTSQIPVDFIFTLRLRSALPIREALVRLRQFQDTSKLNEKELAAFNAQTKGLLDCPACANNYVLTLSSKSTNSPGADAVYTLFRGARLADLQRYVYIANETGERRELVHFVPPKVPGEEAIFFFPRLGEKGRPLLLADNRELLVSFANNDANSIGNFKIALASLTLNGKIEF
jgi:hypothetical protein